VVFREGAETILFYQALVAGTNTYVNMLWLGLAVGVVGLVAVFILIRYFSIKLPIKPFFFGTSILLFVMCISFVGSGIKELQEGRLVSATTINGLSSIDLLGIYPTWETVIPQLVLLAITVATLIYRVNKWRLNKTTAETTTKESA
jgi:high-affinity iron transporter